MKILSAIILFLSSSIVYGQTIRGTVIDSTRKKIISYATVHLIDSCSNVKEQISDEKGSFKFTDVFPGFYSIKISYSDYGDTIFQNIKLTHDLDIKFDIHKYCQYDSSRKNKTCPQCHRKDMVVPIIYGFPTTFYLYKEGEVWFGGCNVTYCDPHWHCKRDDRDF